MAATCRLDTCWAGVRSIAHKGSLPCILLATSPRRLSGAEAVRSTANPSFLAAPPGKGTRYSAPGESWPAVQSTHSPGTRSPPHSEPHWDVGALGLVRLTQRRRLCPCRRPSRTFPPILLDSELPWCPPLLQVSSISPWNSLTSPCILGHTGSMHQQAHAYITLPMCPPSMHDS